ncbi:MAG TPA: right-handed parallel beta-helix repeat-containing protein, partial [Candidatus Omnitrophota bacterium]|nr:right-handed parallel beta-helix repeat-containing protein [Candidatus Omnitrophota bacterium]
AGQGNYIGSNESDGIYIINSNSNEVVGNEIGRITMGTFEAAFPNEDPSLSVEKSGIDLAGTSSYNIIGANDVTGSGRNLISNNQTHGIIINVGCDHNMVKGNLIGTTADGNLPAPNGFVGGNSGISVQGNYNTIGGTSAGKRNVIAGNVSEGMDISGSSNEVIGNYIGTNISGNGAVANSGNGIYLSGSHNTVGGAAAGSRNIISGNGGNGIRVFNWNYNQIIGNYIGTTTSPYTDLGNGGCGVTVYRGKYNLIKSNTISYNGKDGLSPARDGVNVDNVQAIHDTISQNATYVNHGKGISLTGGSNQGIGTPEITSCQYLLPAQNFHFTGTATPLAQVELFGAFRDEGSAYGATATADATGSWEVTFHYPGITPGTFMVADQTDTTGNTSEFGATKEVEFLTVYNHRPDAAVATLESGADYNAIGVYENMPVTQTRAISVPTDEAATFYFKLYNAGDTDESFLITAEGSSSPFTVKYYDSKTSSHEITSNITGSGGPTPLIVAGSSLEIRGEISYGGNAVATKEITIALSSTIDTTKRDAVKGIATFVPVTPSTIGRFNISVPAGIIAGQTFTGTVTAYDASGSIEPNVTGTTSLAVDAGLVTPDALPAAAFINGVASGPLVLSKVGIRTITATNGTATGAATALVYNASRELSSTDLGVPGMSISVPAGAATEEVSISVVETTAPANAPAGYKIGGKVFDITATPRTFFKQVTVTMPIEGPLDDVKVEWWNGSSWTTDGVEVIGHTDTSITFTTTHFTIYTSMGALSSNLVRFGPNPYNPNNGSGKFWYWLDANKDTSIYLIDLGGTIVWKQTYNSGTNGARQGENNISYDGKTAWGDVLGNGVYLFKLVQDGKSIGGGKIAVIK